MAVHSLVKSHVSVPTGGSVSRSILFTLIFYTRICQNPLLQLVFGLPFFFTVLEDTSCLFYLLVHV